MRVFASCLGVVLLASGCVAALSGSNDEAFKTSWRDADGVPLKQIHGRMRAAAKPHDIAMVVGVAEHAVVARPLSGEHAGWRLQTKVVAEPAVSGSIVVLSTPAEFIGLEAVTGKRLWAIPRQDRPLFGIDDDGRRTLMTLGRSPSEALVVDRSGSVVMRVEAPHLLGAPALRGPYAFVPWRNQFVSVFEIESGDEVARMNFPRQVSQAVSIGDGLYFGELGLLHFDDSVADGGPSYGMWLQPDTKPLPGSPGWFQRGSRVARLPLTAEAFTRVFARPEGKVLDQRGFSSSYFRVAFGIDADTAAVRWLHTAERPLLGGSAARDGFVFCTGGGSVFEVHSPEGASRQLFSLGVPLSACVVSASDHHVPALGEVQPFAEQLTAALMLNDAQMLPAQRFVLKQMRFLSEPSLTKTLIDVLQRSRPAPVLKRMASELLAKRKIGVEHMMAALERPYDYLADVLQPPPVAPLAQALAELGHQDAAPLLANHLNDPSHDAPSVLAVARALQALAGPGEEAALLEFFMLNHATADSAALAEAVTTVAEKLLEIGSQQSLVSVQEAAKSPMTHPSVRESLESMFEWSPEDSGG